MASEAEGDLWSASLRALRESDDERAVEALGLLVFVQGSQLAHYADADRTARLASAAVVRLGDADGLRGALLRNEAAYLTDAGRYDEAAPLLAEARSLGDARAARGADENALEGATRASGETSVEAGYARQGLAADALLTGDGETALREARRALQVLRETLGATHPGAVETEVLLGRAQTLTGHLDEAEATLTHALQEAERLQIVGAATHAEMLRALGEVSIRRGVGPRARPLLERVLRIVDEAKDGDPLDDADARAALARALALPGGDAARARTLAAEAMAAYTTRGREAERCLAQMRALELALAVTSTR